MTPDVTNRISEALQHLRDRLAPNAVGGFPLGRTLFEEITTALALLAAEQAKAPPIREGHGEPCYYCGKPCDDLAGNPSMWSLGFPHADDPGVLKHQHVRCVLERLPENAAKAAPDWNGTQRPDGTWAADDKAPPDRERLAGDEVTLAQARPGLFLFDGSLGLKTEYHTDGQMDVYCVDGGEAFWGGTSNFVDRAGLIVREVDAAALRLSPVTAGEWQTRASTAQDTIDTFEHIAQFIEAEADRHRKMAEECKELFGEKDEAVVRHICCAGDMEALAAMVRDPLSEARPLPPSPKEAGR